jgi:hypothetical protein
LSESASQLQWQWTKGQSTAIADFGDPLGGDTYGLCIFDESGPTPHLAFRATTRAGQCGLKPCWKPAGARSLAYKDGEQIPDGIAALRLKSGGDGKAKVLVSGKGANLDLPTLPLALPARVQLQAANGQCWEARYFELGTTRNDGVQFKGRAYQP